MFVNSLRTHVRQTTAMRAWFIFLYFLNMKVLLQKIVKLFPQALSTLMSMITYRDTDADRWRAERRVKYPSLNKPPHNPQDQVKC